MEILYREVKQVDIVKAKAAVENIKTKLREIEEERSKLLGMLEQWLDSPKINKIE
jgi:hypothetical protein